MFFVYALQSDKTGRFYIGSTEDPERRLAERDADLCQPPKTGII
jgi:predicted GIY-YIG superfamily endonuclease